MSRAIDFYLRSAFASLRAPAKPGLAYLRSAFASLRAPANPGLAYLRSAFASLRAPANPGLALAIALALVAGCKTKTAQPNGLGPYRFGHTSLASLNNNPGMTSPMTKCQPTELTDGRKATWCFALNPIKVGERTAEVDAYFLGSEPPLLAEGATEDQKKARLEQLRKLPLIELQLKIRGCVETQVEQWMRQRYGGADPDSKGTHVYWHNDFLWAMAELPSEPGRCMIHFLPATEGAEISRLKAKQPKP